MIIFLRTRHQYDSYRDFWRLVELSGFDICHLDEVDLTSDNTYVFTPFNGEVDCLSGTKYRRRCRIIFWLLERPDAPGRPTVSAVVDSALRIADDVWVSDAWYAGLDPRLIFMPMGSHPGLGCPAPWEERIHDFAHISYAWGRRAEAYNACLAQGLRAAPHQAEHSAQRDIALGRTRFMVNLQQYPTARIVAPIRFAVAAANKMCLVSEELENVSPLRDQDLYTFSSQVRLHTALEVWNRDLETAKRIGESLHDRLCVELTFRKCIESHAER